MPKSFLEIDTSPFLDLDGTQRQLFHDFQKLLGEHRVADSHMWTCLGWRVPGERRVFLDRDEIVLRLHDAMLQLRTQQYWWPMIAVIVKSRPDPNSRRSGRWHAHILEIAGRQPSNHHRELIHGALRDAGFSNVQLDDLTLGTSEFEWWKARKEAKSNGHEGYKRYVPQNVAEHDDATPFAVYKSSNVSGPALPGEDVAREILRAARSTSAPAISIQPAASPAAEPPSGDQQTARGMQDLQETICSTATPQSHETVSSPTAQHPADKATAKKTAWASLRAKEVRQAFSGMLLESVEIGARYFRDKWGYDMSSRRWDHSFVSVK